jgi:agmatinase
MNTYLKKKQIKNFNPEGIRESSKLFGLPFTIETAEVVVIPVPWDVTSTVQGGTSLGPSAVLNASTQVELYVDRIEDAWKMGIAMLPIDKGWHDKNNEARIFTEAYFNFLNGGEVKLSEKDKSIIIKNINALSENINEWVFQKSSEIIKSGQIPIVLGGDHSVPFGLMKAISQKYDSFGVLQIGAKANMIPAHQNFTYSHASIMHNLLQLSQVSKLVQLGTSDFYAKESGDMNNDDRISTFYDYMLARESFEGVPWSAQTDRIIARLPEKVYISLDINSLALQFSSITVIPSWLTYHHLIYLFDKLALTGRQIIGFDICEVSGSLSNWHAIIGARLLYYLSNITGITNKLLRFK